MAADIYFTEDVLLNLCHMEKILSGKSIERATSYQTYRGTNKPSIEKKQN